MNYTHLVEALTIMRNDLDTRFPVSENDDEFNYMMFNVMHTLGELIDYARIKRGEHE